MGPTSSWSFCRRVLALLGTKVPAPEPPVDPWDLEVLKFSWTPIGLDDQPDVGSLPTYDYAVYLLSVVKFHLGPLGSIIEHGAFSQRLGSFYVDPVAVAKQSRFWYSQFLFVLAFGEAFTQIGVPETVPGMAYASRGMAMIPSTVPIGLDSSAVVEALCMAALYFQALDLRLMAFQHVSRTSFCVWTSSTDET